MAHQVYIPVQALFLRLGSLTQWRQPSSVAVCHVDNFFAPRSEIVDSSPKSMEWEFEESAVVDVERACRYPQKRVGCGCVNDPLRPRNTNAVSEPFLPQGRWLLRC